MLKITSQLPPSHHSDLDKAFAKYRGAYHIGSKSKTSEARKRKEQRKKSKNRRLNASNNKRKRACIIFRSLGGEPVGLCYEPDIYGSQQIDSVDEETLLLFTSKTDKACLRDLFFLFPLFYGESWKTSSWFLLYIGSAQLIRRRVKIDQLWICFSFWWNIFNNRLTAVRIDICYSLSWCLYWESFIAFNFIYISNKT